MIPRFFKSYDVACDFFHSYWVSSLPQLNSRYWIELIIILKAPNPTGQLACLEEEILTFQSSYGRATHSP